MTSTNKVVANAMAAVARNAKNEIPHIKVGGYGFLDEAGVTPKEVIDEFIDSDSMTYAKDGVGEIANENPQNYSALANYDRRAGKIVQLIAVAKQMHSILRTL